MPNVKGRLTNLIRSRLPQGKFARGVTLLAGGNVLGQVMMLVSAPILTRLYSPDDFGLLALYMSITVTFQVILSMRYELAIALTDTVGEAMALLKLCLSIVLFFSIVSLAVVLLFGDSLATRLGAPELSNYLWMVPISLLLIGSFNTFKFWCVHEGAFARIGKARLKQVLASLVVQIGGSSLGPVSLIAGQVANQMMGMGSLGSKPLRMPEFKSVSLADMKKVLIRYRRFPLYSSWASLFNSFSRQLPTFVFVILFGPAAAGFYALTNRVLKAPSQVFIGALNDVFLKSAATAYRDGNLKQLTLLTYKNTTLMTLPWLLLLAIISPELFAIVFGEQWSVAGDFARWMTILVFFEFVVSPLSRLYVIYEKQSSELVYQIVLLISRAFALFFGAQIGDAITAVMLYATISAVCHTGFLIWVGIQIGNGVAPMVRQSVHALSIALVVSAPTIIANYLQLDPAVRIVALICSAVLCCLYLFRLAKQIK